MASLWEDWPPPAGPGERWSRRIILGDLGAHGGESQQLTTKRVLLVLEAKRTAQRLRLEGS